ncbi:hypothetical protein C9374_000136 [Naegleria lovaniensis]|uniref:Rieske domain-containing protein n=1 Tax=Naegleria lovaniensis TaxID=51637 RepID=A0AA88GX54_NAELO|nr:uncharacterized protein C9374_000136 [Naegleria lovaniensis]KAG2388697.1 hypothetical protein C9374_000136 [Naegleria lovaniensis]
MKFIYGILFEPLDRVIDLEQEQHNHTHTTISHSSHHLASRYRKRLGEFPPVYPNGWFKVCNSWELKPGQVKYVRMLGLELALYRGEKSHRAYALDAYCTHLGANLTVGGQVHGECLTCPFHHWSFKGENGQCVSLGNIPIEMPMIKKNGKLVQHLQVRDDSFQDCQKVEYCEHRDVAAQLNEKSTTPKDILIQTTTTNTEEHKHSQNSKIPSQANTKSYILEEKNDQIYLWFDAEGRPPHWKVPSVRPNLKTHGKLAHHIYCHIQEIPENGPDAPQEMKYTFGWIWNIWGAKWQKSTLEHQDHIAYFQVQHVSTFNDLFNIPFSVVDVNGGQYGPGIVMFEFSTPLGSFDLIQTVTPVGPLHQHVEHVIYCPWFIPRWLQNGF